MPQVNWKSLNKQMDGLYAQKWSNERFEKEERENKINRERGFRIKGDRMVVHPIRVPEAQHVWLQQNPEATEQIRNFVISLMREDRESRENIERE